MKGNEQLQSTSGSTSHPLPVHFWPALCPQLYPTDFYLYVDMVYLLCRFSTNIVFFEKLRNYPNLTKKILIFRTTMTLMWRTKMIPWKNSLAFHEKILQLIPMLKPKQKEKQPTNPQSMAKHLWIQAVTKRKLQE